MSTNARVTSQAPALDDPVAGLDTITQEVLETSTYLRAGSDLILQSADGQEITVDGYFHSNPPPALMASNGAYLSGETVSLLAGPASVQFAQATGETAPAGAPEEIGKVETLDGTATAQHSDGAQVELKLGDPVFQGDVVEVSGQGKLGITFADGAVFSLSNGGTMVLNEMVYDPGGTSNNMAFNLIKGSLGFVTGAIAGSGGVEVSTPVAVMAIRGTMPLAVQLDDGNYAFLSAQGTFTILPKLPGGEIVQVVDGQGAYLFSADGSSKLVSLTDSGIEGAVSAILDHLRSSYQEKLDREASNTGSPDFGEDSRFGSIDGEVFLIKLAQLLAPVLLEEEVELEPDIIGNLPPQFLVLSGDTASPPPIPEVDGTLIANGTLTIFDANQPDSVTTSVISVVASGKTKGLGSPNSALLSMLVVVPGLAEADAGDNNNVDWTFNSGGEYFNYLGHDETLTLTYTVRGTDGPGATDDIIFVIVIDGTNDTPQITAVNVFGTATEDAAIVSDNPNTAAIETSGYLTDTGSISFVDVDVTDTVTTTVAWTSSGTTGPAISTGSDLDLAIKNAMKLSGDINQVPAGDANGNAITHNVDWTFALDNTLVQYLADGETITIVYRIAVQDDSLAAPTIDAYGEVDTAYQEVTVVITGSNDQPTISVETGDSTGDTLDETDAGLTTNGTLTTNDVDLSDTVTAQVVSVTPSGDTTGIGPDNATLLGMLTLTAGPINADAGNVNNLAWTFDSSEEAFNYLADGESLTLTYLVQVTDDSGTGNDTSVTQSVTIVITGTNDAPVIDSIAQTDIDETLDASAITSPITVTFTDVDLTDIGHTATVTSTGTSGVTTGLALDQAGLEALINVDLVSKLSGSSGGQVDLTFSATSTDFDYLAAGEQATLTYSILIDDGDGNPATQGQDAETFTVVITGTNDAPVIDSIAQTDIDETLDASAITSPITVTFTDVDLTDIGHTATVTSTGTSGVTTGLALDQAGLEALINVDLVSKLSGSSGGQVDLTFSATSTDFDYLAAGEQATLTYSILIDDGDGNPATQGQDAETFTVVITGTNDAPVIDSIAQTDIDETLDASAITSRSR